MNEIFNPDQIAAGRRLFSTPSLFVLGAAELEQLPPASGIEIAFAGRSNVGKSSLINALTGVKGLARASNTPGRTRELNVFSIGDQLTLVDLPGYGYAKAAGKDVSKWQSTLRGYLRGRAGLARALVLIDARHGVLAADEEMFDLLDAAAVTFQLVLTKVDKIKPGAVAKIRAATEALALRRPAAFPRLHATSSKTGAGLDELRAEIANLL